MHGWSAARPILENIANALEMTVISRDWLPYQLPLKKAWFSSKGIKSERTGELFRISTNDGHIGWGDYAPLPEFGITEEAARLFALETAYLDIASQSAGCSLNSWLSDQVDIPNATVNINLGAISKITADDADSAIEQGYSVLKIKLGIRNWRDEIAQLTSLANFLPTGISLRLDANAAWSIAEAQGFISSCADLPIEGLEEPLKHPSHNALRALQNIATFPLAIDESIKLIDSSFFNQPPVHRLVLKPARHGGLLPSMAIALRAQAAGIECIVTSGLESVCGVLACAHLAVAIAPQSVHGLATGEWFTEDTGEPLIIKNGRLALPCKTGLGFSKKE